MPTGHHLSDRITAIARAMTDLPIPFLHQPRRNNRADGPASGSSTAARLWLSHLKWAIPLTLLAVVAIYEAGPSQWLHQQLNGTWSLLIDMALYGTLGPALVFAILHFLERWMEERETSDLQARLLARTRRQAETSQQVTDDTLQALFAANIYLTSLERAAPELPPEAAQRLHDAQAALDKAICQLREHLLNTNK
jgi:hypothetical protein